MARFFIEVPHEADKISCLHAVHTLLSTGSHFLTHADFGCYDGEHKAWIIVDVESKDAARAILPTEFRTTAKIVGLNKFSLDEINEMLKHHTD